MRGMDAADALAADGWSVGVVNARYAKPLDAELILDQARGKKLVVTLEESVVSGGFGSAVLELLADAGLTDASLRGLPVRLIGLPGAKFVDHASAADLRRVLRIDTRRHHRPGARGDRSARAETGARQVRGPHRLTADPPKRNCGSTSCSSNAVWPTPAQKRRHSCWPGRSIVGRGDQARRDRKPGDLVDAGDTGRARSRDRVTSRVAARSWPPRSTRSRSIRPAACASTWVRRPVASPMSCCSAVLRASMLSTWDADSWPSRCVATLG